MTDQPQQWDMEVDLVAAGSSSGGLVAALVGHDLGLKTVVIEKAEALGGGTALSGGIIWIPNNHHMQRMGLPDSREDALAYLRGMGMGRHVEEKAAAFIDHGAEMMRYVEEHTSLKMIAPKDYPDYRAELPGGKLGGRYLLPDPLGMALDLAEAEQRLPFLRNVRRPPVSLQLGVPDGVWVGGRTLIGPLACACLDRGIDILNLTRARRLIFHKGRVVGLQAERNGKDFFIKANRGVLLATGGFEWNAEMNRRFIHGSPIHAFTNPQNEGDGHIMGMEVGAAVALMDHTMWLPTIRVPDEKIDGQPLFRLFLASCGKPGDIFVNRHGQRCCNESFYPDMGRAFIAYDAAASEFTNLPIYWIADQSHRDKYYCGPLAPEVSPPDDNWLQSAGSIGELAQRLNLPRDQFERTVARFNQGAREGRTLTFIAVKPPMTAGLGDPNHEPNPCLAPLEKAPFYGVRIHPGTAGNQGGLVTNESAQVVNVRGEAIPGLYATSNTSAHLAVGFGYNSGFSNGQSMVFGYVTARHIAGMEG